MENFNNFSANPTRPRNVVDTEYRSRLRRQVAYGDLKIRVENLPPNILEVLLSRVAPPPTTRSSLVQAQVYGVSSLVVDEYPTLLDTSARLQAENENLKRQIAQLCYQVQLMGMAAPQLNYN